ncbi:MAG: N-acetylneuraminate synthase family protein [Rhodospirillales bacterium]|jgi:N,N'-diacetyllegionaminate synthase
MIYPWEHKVFIIAEAGVNHNGDEKLAMKLIDAAAETGVDAVKFQTWKPGELTGKFSYKVGYLEKTTEDTESRYELSNRLALPFDVFRRLQAYAEKRNILFLSTPDGFESLDFLSDDLDIPYIKVGSTEVTHIPFLEKIGSKRKPVFLSTGLSSLKEVRTAINSVRKHGDLPLVALQCTSEYPAPNREINVRAMKTMADTFDIPVGLSDHSTGHEAAVSAVALGAQVIEKHFTLDKSLPGPDHLASLDPEGLSRFVVSIRDTEILLGDGIKRLTESEAKNKDGIRRSVVATSNLSKGTILTKDHLLCKRPGYGIAPADLDKLVGCTLASELEEDQPIEWKHIIK